MYYYWSEEITKSDCEKIINEFDTSKSVDATTGNYQKTLYPEEIEEYKKNGNWDFDKNQPKNINTPDESTRKTKLNWLPLQHKFNKILSEYVTKANTIMYHYDIGKFTPCQFARYDVGDFYNYHQDSGHNIVEYEKETRKLSMTLQLSDPDTYEGGQFFFYNGNKEEEEPEIQKQGSILVFDSRMWHRVAPVTKGVRYSLVSWVLGPHFR
tara:strand:- start:44 stop:673 length:630 start_codon:yes stop_codon:yes gene_type:complete